MHGQLPKVSETMGRSRRSVVVVIAATLCIVLTIALVGCGGATSVPVSGQVTLDGKPVAECAVLFVSVAGGPVASGTTDAEGRFQLATTNRPSVAIGEYSVAITKKHVTDIADKTTGEHRLQVDWLTPQMYSRAETSGLRKTVSTLEHDFVFDLSSK